MELWFYIRVCSDEAVAEAAANGLPKASALVSQMTAMEGARLADCFDGGIADATASEGFALTSRRQISCDLVEEWIGLNRWPLSSEVHFASFT